jgi:hypothetical protein
MEDERLKMEDGRMMVKYNRIHVMGRRFFLFLLLITGLTARSLYSQESITVKAGTKIIDYFPRAECYRYPEFITGKVLFKDGTYTEARFNYNILFGEMQFIQHRDTLSIANANRISLVILDPDTFYYDQGYLEILFNKHPVEIALKHYVKIVDIKKSGGYGTTSSTSAISSYGSISASTGYHKLQVSEDIVVREEKEYYIRAFGKGFELLRKNAVLQAFPEEEENIKQYLKEHKIDFRNEEDILDLMHFISH